MIRKGWTDRILGWFCVIGVFAWVTSVEVRLSYDRQWRVAAQGVLRGLVEGEGAGRGVFWPGGSMTENGEVLDGEIWVAGDAESVRIGRLSFFAPPAGDPNGLMDFAPPVGGPNDADLIQAAIDAAEDGYGSGVDGPGIDDDAIRRLCESGRVCEVMGHCWQPCPVTWLADIDGMEEALDWRPRCGLCGKVKNERDYLE